MVMAWAWAEMVGMKSNGCITDSFRWQVVTFDECWMLGWGMGSKKIVSFSRESSRVTGVGEQSVRHVESEVLVRHPHVIMRRNSPILPLYIQGNWGWESLFNLPTGQDLSPEWMLLIHMPLNVMVLWLKKASTHRKQGWFALLTSAFLN